MAKRQKFDEKKRASELSKGPAPRFKASGLASEVVSGEGRHFWLLFSDYLMSLFTLNISSPRDEPTRHMKDLAQLFLRHQCV